MAQAKGFSCGGFVVHKALGKNLSAWYDADCNLLDSVLTDKPWQAKDAWQGRFRDA